MPPRFVFLIILCFCSVFATCQVIHFSSLSPGLPEGYLSQDSAYLISINNQSVELWEKSTERKVFSNRYTKFQGGINNVVLNRNNTVMLVGNLEGELTKVDFKKKEGRLFVGAEDPLGDMGKVGFSNKENFFFLYSDILESTIIWNNRDQFVGIYPRPTESNVELSRDPETNKLFHTHNENYKVEAIGDSIILIYSGTRRQLLDSINLRQSVIPFEGTKATQKQIAFSVGFDGHTGLRITDKTASFKSLESIPSETDVDGYTYEAWNSKGDTVLVSYYNPGFGNTRYFDVDIKSPEFDPNYLDSIRNIKENKKDSVLGSTGKYIIKLPKPTIASDYYEYPKKIKEVSKGSRYKNIIHQKIPLGLGIDAVCLSQDGNFLICSYGTFGVELVDLKNGFATGGSFGVQLPGLSHIDISADNQYMILGNDEGIFRLYRFDFWKTHNYFPEPLLTIIASPDSTLSYIIPGNYYYASKDVLKRCYFVQSLQSISLSQFDNYLNRPDLVLETVFNLAGKYDTSIILAHKNAWIERVKYLNIDTSLDIAKVSFPEITIKKKGGSTQTDGVSTIQLAIRASTGNSLLSKINVWVNDVPLYGKEGIDIRNLHRKHIDTTITVNLSSGENFIEAEAVDVNQIQSARINYVVENESKLQKSKLYFIGIGINKFKNLEDSLTFSQKDVQDLAKMFKGIYQDSIVLKTLYNDSATEENILSLKHLLKNTKPDDKVIIAYAGHGVIFEKKYYLSSYNTNFKQPDQNSILYENFEALLDGIPARKKLILIDACHSAEFNSDDLSNKQSEDSTKSQSRISDNNLLSKISAQALMLSRYDLMKELFTDMSNFTGSTIIAASSALEYAIEDERNENSYFTKCLLTAQKRFPTMTVGALAKFLSDEVFRESGGKQRPIHRRELQRFDWNIW